MRVGPKQHGEARGGAALPLAGTFSNDATKSIPATRGPQPKLPRDAPADNQWLRDAESSLRKVCFANAASAGLGFLLRLLGASFQRDVAVLGLQVHVMLHTTEDELRIGEVLRPETMPFLFELLQRDVSRGDARQCLFHIRHLAIVV